MPDHFPHPYTLQDQIVEEEGELLLYRFHGWLHSLSLDVKLRHLSRLRDLERAMSYLDARDPARARLLRGALQMIGAVLDEATELLNDGIHWPTIEGFFCPSEDGFLDTPAGWLAVGQEQTTGASALASENAPPAPESQIAEKCPETAPRGRASGSALRSLGRSLRSEREYEMRRFYAIAQKHELPTDESAAPALRKALSHLLGEPIATRKQLTARQWALAASAIETEDLHWEAPRGRVTVPLSAPRP